MNLQGLAQRTILYYTHKIITHVSCKCNIILCVKNAPSSSAAACPSIQVAPPYIRDFPCEHLYHRIIYIILIKKIIVIRRPLHNNSLSSHSYLRIYILCIYILYAIRFAYYKNNNNILCHTVLEVYFYYYYNDDFNPVFYRPWVAYTIPHYEYVRAKY